MTFTNEILTVFKLANTSEKFGDREVYTNITYLDVSVLRRGPRILVGKVGGVGGGNCRSKAFPMPIVSAYVRA